MTIGDPPAESGPAVLLRPIVEADLATLHRWYQTPELSEHLVDDIPRRDAGESIPFMRGWLAHDARNQRFAVVRRADGRLLGRTALLNIEDGSAELHLFLGDPDTRGHGYGRQAVEVLLAVAFDQLRLDEVRLEVLGSNAAARALYRRIGFNEQGPRETGVIKHGARIEVVRMAIRAGTWRHR